MFRKTILSNFHECHRSLGRRGRSGEEKKQTPALKKRIPKTQM